MCLVQVEPLVIVVEDGSVSVRLLVIVVVQNQRLSAADQLQLLRSPAGADKAGLQQTGHWEVGEDETDALVAEVADLGAAD